MFALGDGLIQLDHIQELLKELPISFMMNFLRTLLTENGVRALQYDLFSVTQACHSENLKIILSAIDFTQIDSFSKLQKEKYIQSLAKALSITARTELVGEASSHNNLREELEVIVIRRPLR